MLIGPRKMLSAARIFGSKNYLGVNAAAASFRHLHLSAIRPTYAEAELLEIPNNIDPAETTRFSPQRSRDISATAIVSHYAQRPAAAAIDITAEKSYVAPFDALPEYDAHVQSYDCSGAVSLNSSMQSNVPSPFGGMHSFSHLNMPGGQWSQEYKFTSQNLQSSHYRALREDTRASWVAAYDPSPMPADTGINNSSKRSYSSQASTPAEPSKAAPETTTPAPTVLSKKEQLKLAFRDYGATVVVFHVAMSLASLGCCYMLVSNGINMIPIMEFLGIASSAIAEKVASGSTFVVAYAIHKVFAPVRITVTLTVAPFLVHYLRRKGILKAKAKTI